MLCIRIGFSADPDPVLFISIRFQIQRVRPMRIRILGIHKKLNFYMKNILKVGNMSKRIPTNVQKPFWKAVNQDYLLILVNIYVPGSGFAYAIRIRIQDSRIIADSDPQHVVKYMASGGWLVSELVRENVDAGAGGGGGGQQGGPWGLPGQVGPPTRYEQMVPVSNPVNLFSPLWASLWWCTVPTIIFEMLNKLPGITLRAGVFFQF